MGKGGRHLPMVHSPPSPRYAREIRSVHQAMRAGVRAGSGMDARSTPAACRSRAQSGSQGDPRWDREMPEGSETQMSIRRVSVIDSHTGGEPTRVVVEGGPALGDGPLDQRLAMFREKHDAFRSAIVNEPRGSDVLVGALLGAAEYPI